MKDTPGRRGQAAPQSPRNPTTVPPPSCASFTRPLLHAYEAFKVPGDTSPNNSQRGGGFLPFRFHIRLPVGNTCGRRSHPAFGAPSCASRSTMFLVAFACAGRVAPRPLVRVAVASAMSPLSHTPARFLCALSPPPLASLSCPSLPTVSSSSVFTPFAPVVAPVHHVRM